MTWWEWLIAAAGLGSIFANDSKKSDVEFSTGPLDFNPSDRERALRDWLLQDFLGSHAYQEHASWLKDRLVIDGLEVPISQVLGFGGFLGNASEITAAETTTSATYADLGTAGPSITGLADGTYLVFFGCVSVNTAGNLNSMSLSINGAAAADPERVVMQGTDQTNISRAIQKTVANDGNNTITAKYKTSGGTATFGNRWLITLKTANA